MSVQTKNYLAKIAIAKNLIKEYKTSESERTVYLENGTEFQIYLKNPYQYHLGIKIYVNGKSIGNMLVLRPGQSHWLDRFIDVDRKLLFSTYEVEDSAEMKYATSKNGKVRIEFYHENTSSSGGLLISTVNPPYYSYDGSTYLNDRSTYLNLNLNCENTCSNSINSSTSCLYSACENSISSAKSSDAMLGVCDTTLRKELDIDNSAMENLKASTIETGRIEKGSKSNQKFEDCYVQFNTWVSQTEEIQILPNSRKQIHVEDTRRKYCSNCGKKVSPKDKFCSNCGEKLK